MEIKWYTKTNSQQAVAITDLTAIMWAYVTSMGLLNIILIPAYYLYKPATLDKILCAEICAFIGITIAIFTMVYMDIIKKSKQNL
jgi:hypothetical protein